MIGRTIISPTYRFSLSYSPPMMTLSRSSPSRSGLMRPMRLVARIATRTTMHLEPVGHEEGDDPPQRPGSPLLGDRLEVARWTAEGAARHDAGRPAATAAPHRHRDSPVERRHADGRCATATIVERGTGSDWRAGRRRGRSANVGRWRPQARARCPTVRCRTSTKPADSQIAPDGGRIVADPDQRMRVRLAGLDEWLDRMARPVGQAQVDGHERVASVHGRHDEGPARAQPWRAGS